MNTVAIPNLIGMELIDAREMCNQNSLVLVAADDNGEPLGSRTWPGYFVVTRQTPAPGTVVEPGAALGIDFAPFPGVDSADVHNFPKPPLNTLKAHASPEDTEKFS